MTYSSMHYRVAVMYYLRENKQTKKNKQLFRDGMPKSMQQDKDGIKVKVNVQSPIPASFSH